MHNNAVMDLLNQGHAALLTIVQEPSNVPMYHVEKLEILMGRPATSVNVPFPPLLPPLASVLQVHNVGMQTYVQ